MDTYSEAIDPSLPRYPASVWESRRVAITNSIASRAIQDEVVSMAFAVPKVFLFPYPFHMRSISLPLDGNRRITEIKESIRYIKK